MSTEMIDVQLVGGPADWHGQTIPTRRTELDRDRDALGTMLITNGVPDGHPDPGARAHYSPDPTPAPPAVWFFRGWVPYGPTDWPRPTSGYAPATVDVDARGVPVTWTSDDGTQWTVNRVLAHWVNDRDGTHGTDVGLWHLTATTTDPDALTVGWELHHNPGGEGWTAAPLPR